MKIQWHVGELLVQKGLITWDQLEGILEDQKEMIRKMGGTKGSRKSSVFFLGEILIRNKWADWDEVERALVIQRETERLRLLGQILVDEGVLTEENLCRALAFQFNMQYVDFTKISVQKNAIQMVPKQFALAHNLMPLVKNRDSLLVAVSDPLDFKPLSELESMLKDCSVVSALAPWAQIKGAHKLYYDKN